MNKWAAGAAAVVGLAISTQAMAQYSAAIYNSTTDAWRVLPGNPNSTATDNQAYGINTNGLVVGTSLNSADGTNAQGWLWNGSAYTPIVAPGADLTLGGTYAKGINDSGVVVGRFTDSTGTHGFIKSGTTYTPLDWSTTVLGTTVPAASTTAYSVNNNGVVAGTFSDGSHDHGFTYNGSYSAAIDFPTAVQTNPVTDTFVTAINNKGDLAGFYDLADGSEHGFEALTGTSGTQWITLDSPNPDPNLTGTDLFGLNDNRVAAGYDNPFAGPGLPNADGLIFNGTTGTLVNAPGANNTLLFGLNNAGLVAASVDGSVPEPASLGLIAAAGVLFSRRRRNV